MPLEEKYVDGMNGLERAMKRGFDICASLFGLILLSPVFLYVYLRLRRQADGPVIFRQERIGKGGKPFDILKFRTMRVDAEEEGKPQLAERSDDRLTPVGTFLREHHLDELPQLWNVLSVTCRLWAIVQNDSISLTRLCRRIQTTSVCTRFVRVSLPWPPSITAIRTPWRKCSSACKWIWSTCRSVVCGST